MFRIISIIRHSIKQTDSVISIRKRTYGSMEDWAIVKELANVQGQNQNIRWQIINIRREQGDIIEKMQNLKNENEIVAQEINMTRLQRLAKQLRENIMARIFTERQPPFQFFNEVAKYASEQNYDQTKMTNIEKMRWHKFVSELDQLNFSSSQLDDDAELIMFICEMCAIKSHIMNVWKSLFDEINPNSTN